MNVMKPQLHKRVDWRTVWQIIAAADADTMSLVKAAQWLDVALSRVSELRRRYRALRAQRRDPAPDWLYRRSSEGRSFLPEEVRAFLDEELRYWRQESEFFKGRLNFAFLAQECQKRFGRRFHRNTIRRWAVREKLYDPEVDCTGKPFVRFEMGAVGLLFQHDSSIHLWLPHTGRKDTLILTEDDHSRKVVGALLVPHDTAWHHLCVVRDAIETHGCPLAYYLDNHMIFHHPDELNTQFSRALRAVEIAVRFTAKQHPEAKGKIEKRFDYFQRRIPLLCERYHVKNLAEGNKILRDEVAFYNDQHIHAEIHETPEKRWQRAIQEGRSSLRPVRKPDSLDTIFALHYERYVAKDGSIMWGGRPFVVPGAPLRQTVTIAVRPPTGGRRPHTELFVLHQGCVIAHHVLPKRTASS